MATLAHPGWDAHLDTVFIQSEPPDEVVVVVDRAMDVGDRRAIEQSHANVRFIFNEENIGLTRSLNRAIEAARGDLMFRLDDDDFCHRERFARQTDAIRNGGGDIVCSFAYGTRAVNPNKTWLIDHATSDAALKQQLSKRNVIVHSTLGFTRSAIERVGGYDTHFRYAQDYALHLKAIREGLKFAVVGEPLVTRVYSPGAITINKRKQQIMYSSSARLLHAAEGGDVDDFIKSARRSLTLLSVPDVVREARRIAFGFMGKGV